MRSNSLSPLDEGLLYAVSDGHIEHAKKMIEAKCDVNAKDEFGTSAILMAAKRNDLKMIELLVSAGASLATEDKVGFNGLHWAKYYENKAMIELFNQTSVDQKDSKEAGSTGPKSARI